MANTWPDRLGAVVEKVGPVGSTFFMLPPVKHLADESTACGMRFGIGVAGAVIGCNLDHSRVLVLCFSYPKMGFYGAADKRDFLCLQLSYTKPTMADRLPPLTALRAFDAAARHMSFARAADELGVTPAALSFQIKSLEAHLGRPVFRRLNRAVELTDAGRTLAPGLSDGFSTLSAAWRATKRLSDEGTLTVTAGPAFTSKWLAPRIYDFAQTHPEIELRVAATLRLIDFDRDEVDAAIRFGLDEGKGYFSEPLIREWMTPMMTPELAARIKRPQDLLDAQLIHDDSTAFFQQPADWAAWGRAAGVDIGASHGARFSQADHALDAAISGAGVLLGRVSLATRALESGRLVAPFQIGLLTKAQFRFVCPKGHESRPQVAAFRAWVKAEIKSSEIFEKGRILIKAEDVA